MRCFDCDEEMEKEEGAILKYESPNAIYSCPSCGGEWVWRRGEKITQIGRSVLGVDVLMARFQQNSIDEYADLAEMPPIFYSDDYA